MNMSTLIPAFIVSPALFGLITTILSNLRMHTMDIPGLLFHSVLPEPKLNMSQIKVKVFRSFLEDLSKKSIKAIPINNPDKTANNCHITFDDGLESVYKYALPLLETFNQKCTVFCVADFCSRTSSWDIFNNQHHLSCVQIRELADLGHEIGSHTLTHANLPFLNNTDMTIELLDSKHKLEDITGKEVSSISFPHGSWNEQVWKKALELGYKQCTLYRKHSLKSTGQYPVYGVYRFDTSKTIMQRLSTPRLLSCSHTVALLMSHFSKGTAIWKFRDKYLNI